MTKLEIKKLLKPFVLIFLASFLLVNFSKIDWESLLLLSNYKFISASAQEFLGLDEFLNLGKEWEKIEEGFGFFKKQGFLKIPRIGVEAPLVFVKSLNKNDLDESLERGVLHYPGSALPGEPGQTVILGHSAPQGWPKKNYNWIFSDLNKLAEGEEIYINFDGKNYLYKVKRKFFIRKGQEIPVSGLTDNKFTLILLSCWPPGKNYKRLGVEAVLR